jgi:arylsulfatase A-like enzyme
MFPSNFFTLEIVTFIFLYQFCSNIELYSKYLKYFQASALTQEHFLIVTYVVGVVSIVGCYCITSFTLNPFLNGKPIRTGYRSIVILFLIVSGCLVGFFAWKHKSQSTVALKTAIATNRQAKVKAPQVILIVLDTVRADRLSLYGHPGVTKNLEAFSRKSLIFENCIASSPWTIPSHASLFTGLNPIEHGSHGDLDPKRNFLGFPVTTPLSDASVTLAEIFRENGYTTAAVAANTIVLRWHKLEQGFHILDYEESIGIVYKNYHFRPILHFFCFATNLYPKYALYYRTADDINRESIRVLEKISSDPFFLFINYLDPHVPYLPPRPFSGYFSDKVVPHAYRHKLNFLTWMNRLDKETRDSYQLSQYDGEIAYLDNQLGQLFFQLKEMGLYDASLIIVTSDHGELFGEHDLYHHRTPMYEGVVRIPLIIKFPFSERIGRERGMIDLSDLYATILSICELPVPGDISGKAFGDDSLPVVSEVYNFDIGEHRIIYDGKYKYMKYEHQRNPELYDLERDPEELENVAETLPEIASAMEEQLNRWKTEHRPQYTSPDDKAGILPEEMAEGLKALGYVQ